MRPRLRRRMPAPQQPDAQRLSYYSAIQRAVLRPARAAMAEELPAILGALDALRREQATAEERQRAALRGDATPHSAAARAAVERAAKAFAGLWAPREVEAMAVKVAAATDRHARRQLDRQVRAAFSVGYEQIEQPVRDRVPAFVHDNVNLIKTVPERYFASIGDEVRQAFETGMLPRTLRDRIAERYGVAQSDAARIARDQVGKLNAQVTADRLEALGSRRYIWRCMNDERTREWHKALEGQVIDNDDPPVGGGTSADERGHAGEGICCRCYREPIFDEPAPAPEAEPEPPAEEAPAPALVEEPPEIPPAGAGAEPTLADQFEPTTRDPESALPGLEAAREVVRQGVRDADLEYLREGMREMAPFREAYAAAARAGIDPTIVAVTGHYPGGEFPPIRLNVAHDGMITLNDGRHRYLAAREAGARAILSRVVVYGPRGAKLRDAPRVVVRLLPDAAAPVAAPPPAMRFAVPSEPESAKAMVGYTPAMTGSMRAWEVRHMSPAEYLATVDPNFGPGSPQFSPRSAERIKQGALEGKTFAPLQAELHEPRNAYGIIPHEGRHRAWVAKEMGVPMVPVYVKPPRKR